MSEQTQRVLMVMLRNPGEQHYGLEVAKTAGVKSGTLYPILARLENAGWLASDWEQVDSAAVGRPPRRYYQLTATGAREALKIRNQLAAAIAASGLQAWVPRPAGGA
jgi:DNA-binding PadR family transcriptional regulator